MQYDLCLFSISNEVIYQGRKYNFYEYRASTRPSPSSSTNLTIKSSKYSSFGGVAECDDRKGLDNDLSLNDS